MTDLTPNPSPGRRGGTRPDGGSGKHRYIVRGQQLGSGKAQRARELRQEMTVQERILWNRLRDGQMAGFRFRRQQVVDGFIVDFYCHAVGLVIEVDGTSHEGRAEYDEEREQILQSRGLRVLRIPNDAVQNDLEQVMKRIRAAAGLTHNPLS